MGDPLFWIEKGNVKGIYLSSKNHLFSEFFLLNVFRIADERGRGSYRTTPEGTDKTWILTIREICFAQLERFKAFQDFF